MTAVGIALVLIGLAFLRAGLRRLPEWLLGTRTAKRIARSTEGEA